jgi:hypothetical protein
VEIRGFTGRSHACQFEWALKHAKVGGGGGGEAFGSCPYRLDYKLENDCFSTAFLL